MKKIRLLGLLALSTLFIATVSCEKADELSQSDIISTEWGVEKVMVDGVKDETTDYSGYTFTFIRDLSYSFTQAPSGKVETEGSWILSDDDKFIYLTGTNGTETTVPINKLTEDNAELVFTIPATYKSPEKIAIYYLTRNQ